MVSLQDSLVSSSARKLPIRFRCDLPAQRQLYLGRIYWIVKEPIGSRYFRLQDEEYAIMKLLNGSRSLDDIKREFENMFPPQKISLEEIQNFLGQLHQNGLIIVATPDQGNELLKRKKKRKKQELFQKFTNVLAIKFKGFDPDTILTALYRYVYPFFHSVFIFFSLVLCLSAILLVVINFDTFRSKLPEFNKFFSPLNILLLSAALGATKILHEFGHGLTAKHFKGECHEMGVMFLVLTPCLYVNVSDSWLLPCKWHRIGIALAGMYVECVLAAICTFVWWFSNDGFLNYLALNIMFVSSVSTIVFNINPLLRYDGYYVMSDLLEIPNLRQKSTKILTRKCMQWFLGMEQPEDPFLPQSNQILFAAYSVAAFCYKWVVLASILFFMYKVFEPYGLKIIGQTIAAASLFSLFVMPLYKVIKFFSVPGRLYKVKKIRFYLSILLFAGVISFLLFFPLPYFVISPAIIELRSTHSQYVYIPNISGGCRLKEVNVKAGQYVEKGESLATLENYELQNELISLEGKLKEFQKELDILQQLKLHSDDAALRIAPLLESIEVTKQVLTEKRRVYNDLKLYAEKSGIVVSPSWKPYQLPENDQLPVWYGSPLEPMNIGTTFESGTVFCAVGDPNYLEAVIVADQSKMGFIKYKDKVELILHELPNRIFIGQINELEEQAVTSIDIQLSTAAGGEVQTTRQKDGSEKPTSASYRVRMLLDNNDNLIKPGMTGIAKIHAAPQTIGMRIWRFLNETFNFKL
ncbi:MAG: biotin/lipoyl-binding protein [Planctomycetaceae bacterium]|jgi:putative peptide zinc metalloprotease protein|nr:biotin/lipoyl-binding protein [Planctomycetaceae bacterium]